MGLQRSRPGYKVRVDGLLLGHSRFVIHAAVEYGRGLSEQRRERLTPMAQLELLLAIEGEEERARLLGADLIRVEVVGDEPLYRFFRGRTKPIPEKAAVPARSPSIGPGTRAGVATRPV